MRNYEVTFIVDPVLSGDEIKSTAQTYVDMLTTEGCKIVNFGEIGLRQLAYPINRRTSGIYYCVEFEAVNGTVIPKAELALTRDERIMRFLTVALDKFGVKYNDDKRNGKIGTIKKKKVEKEETRDRNSRGRKPAPKPAPKAAPKVATPKVAEAPKTPPTPSQEEE